MKAQELRGRRAELISQARGMLDRADNEQRGLTPEERTAYDALQNQIEAAKTDIELRERQEALELEMATLEQRKSAQNPINTPNVLKIPRGDNETRAVAHYLRTGDAGGLAGLEMRQNANDMTIADSTYAGYAVPTGLYNNIVARRDVGMLADILGCRRIPGKGTAVNVPLDNAATTLFVSTA